MRILTIFGTRPEAIKMCPLILELKTRPDAEVRLCVTGQHRQIVSHQGTGQRDRRHENAVDLQNSGGLYSYLACFA